MHTTDVIPIRIIEIKAIPLIFDCISTPIGPAVFTIPRTNTAN